MVEPESATPEAAAEKESSTAVMDPVDDAMETETAPEAEMADQGEAGKNEENDAVEAEKTKEKTVEEKEKEEAEKEKEAAEKEKEAAEKEREAAERREQREREKAEKRRQEEDEEVKKELEKYWKAVKDDPSDFTGK